MKKEVRVRKHHRKGGEVRAHERTIDVKKPSSGQNKGKFKTIEPQKSDTIITKNLKTLIIDKQEFLKILDIASNYFD